MERIRTAIAEPQGTGTFAGSANQEEKDSEKIAGEAGTEKVSGKTG